MTALLANKVKFK
jgi:hypothetical protein